jgi:hypothetical protein
MSQQVENAAVNYPVIRLNCKLIRIENNDIDLSERL